MHRMHHLSILHHHTYHYKMGKISELLRRTSSHRAASVSGAVGQPDDLEPDLDFDEEARPDRPLDALSKSAGLVRGYTALEARTIGIRCHSASSTVSLLDLTRESLMFLAKGFTRNAGRSVMPGMGVSCSMSREKTCR